MRLRIPSDLNGLLQAGLLRSVGSLGIKVATAGLTYLTYVVLSRTQTNDEYGHFAFGLALATVLLATPASAMIGSLVRAFDPIAYAASLAVIVATCLIAALVPASRAARIDPIATLRAD